MTSYIISLYIQKPLDMKVQNYIYYRSLSYKKITQKSSS